MGSLRREQRVERQELDDGDPEATVYISGGGDRRSRGDTYHDDPECLRFKVDGRTELARKDAQRKWMGPCGWCVLEEGPNSD